MRLYPVSPVKAPTKVYASKQVSHLAEFGTRARSYYNGSHDMVNLRHKSVLKTSPFKGLPSSAHRYESRGSIVTRVA